MFPTTEKAQLLLDVEKLLVLKPSLQRLKGCRRVDLELLEVAELEQMKMFLLGSLFGIYPVW